jgi:hypothetical protein
MTVDAEVALTSSQKIKIKLTDADWKESGGDARRNDDSCQYKNDGSCDEPTYCHAGTDCTDCGTCGGYSGGGGGGGGGQSGDGGDSGISDDDWDLLGGGSPKYSDIQQGALGDCYFLASLSAIAYTHPQLLKRMFTKGTLLEGAHPVYTTKWLLNGKPSTLAVTNMMPANPKTGLPYFVQEKGGNYWPLVLEKSWAKLFGDYKTIEAGLQSEVFKAITQAPVETYMHNKVDKNVLWNKLVEGTTNKYPMGGTTPTNPPGNIGVIGGHAYALLGAFAYSSFPQTIQLFNPHHKDHYKGVIPNANLKDGSFYLTLDEYLESYDMSFIAHVIDGAKVSHKVIQKDTTLALEFTMTTDAPFAVQLEWASKRLLKGCGWLSPKFTMLVAKAGDLTSAVQAEKGIQMTNARADMPGGSGTYYVFVRGTFPKVTVLQEMVVNTYGTESPTIDVSSQYPNANDLFLAMKGLCKTMDVPGTGAYGGAAQYALDESSLVNNIPVWKPTSAVQHINGYEVVAWSNSQKKLVMTPSVAKARQGITYRALDVGQATCASLIQENEVAASKTPVEVQPLALVTERVEDTDEDASFDVLSDSDSSEYSAEGCSNSLARLQTLDQGEQIANEGWDGVFPEEGSSIAAQDVNCGDSAIGQSESCAKYNHWMSITKMKTLAAAFKSSLAGGCVQKAELNGGCLVDTALCQTAMKLTCNGWSYTLPLGGRYNLKSVMCGSGCTTDSD